MTEDEILTRLYRCEARQKALETLVVCLFPCIEPHRRKPILEQLGQFRNKLQARLQAPEANAERVEMELRELSEVYASTESTLNAIAAYEERQANKSFFTRQ